jgi:hypothetical protein
MIVTVEKSSQNVGCFSNFENTCPKKALVHRAKFAQSGHPADDDGFIAFLFKVNFMIFGPFPENQDSDHEGEPKVRC